MKIQTIQSIPLGLGILALSAATGSGAVLAQYGLNATSTPFWQPSLEATGVEGTEIVRTASMVRSTSGAPEGAATIAITLNNINDVAAPVGGAAADDNIMFTVSATVPGSALNLSSLTFLTGLSSNLSSTDGVVYTVQYRDLASGGFINIATTPNTQQTMTATQTRTVDLSGAAFDNIEGIEFRINFTEPFETNNTATGSTGISARLDFITLNGDVIPEPSSAMLVLGGVALAAMRRRR